MTETRLYRGLSADERRRRRDRQLREACLDVVADQGVAAVTVEQVCARAGLTKRYFYESFPDRDALLVAVLEELFRTVNRRIVAALLVAGPTRLDRSRAAVGELTDLLADDRRLARLYVEAAGHGTLRPHRDRTFARYAEFWLTNVLRRDPTDPLARLAARHVIAGTTEVLCAWLGGELELGRRRVIDALAELGARDVPGPLGGAR
ncbi:TetR/AcrR family transcriptional regulator [Actinomycetospora soli]|uniref:TetR/AcrR family transcriptional regulator n=1 Tax=Actinomycetospora soli TaxID=2893887 RepID=UPI001E4D8034|nr:TetR/AcrR family transcriptional regulator [Actinomycetospora soli]MCD2187357.1 TetR/AcrR family transcriptional regulator [Actinomycetospora soli]